MNKVKLFLTVFFATGILLSSTAYAYLDPGAGSMLLQVLSASALVIGVAWRHIVRFVKKLFGKGRDGFHAGRG